MTNRSIAWIAGALGKSRVARVAVLGALALGTTGCGALGALTNPKAAWAFDEPAPMSVVVRRAEVASMTAEHVDRLLAGTPLDDESEWVPTTALKKDEAKAILETIAADDTYAAGSKGAKLRIAPAEAWHARFAGICSAEEAHPNLLSATSPALDASYQEVTALLDKLARLKLSKADQEKALEAKDATDAQKAEIEKKIEGIEAEIEKVEDAVEPKQEAFVAKAREEAGKADEATKKRVGVAVLNLKRAVEDAKTMNSVALLRYPMAATSLHEDIQSTAKRVVADVIEEQTGKRPDMSGLKPEVKLDGGDVKLTLNGLSASDLLSLKPDEVVEETTLRLGNYVARVLTLIAFVDESQTRLTFQGEVLDAMIEGMKLNAASVAGAGDEIDLEVDTTTAKKAKADPNDKNAKLRHTPGGLRTSRCDVPKRDAVAAKEPEDAAEKSKPTKDKGSKGKTSKADTKGGPEKWAAPTPSATAGPKKPSGSAPAKPAAPGPTVTAKGATPAAPPADAPKPAGEKPCDVVVTNADGTYCL